MIKIVHAPILLNILALADLVIYPRVYVVNRFPRTVYHGLIHIAQIERLIAKHGKNGVRMFYWNYIRDWVKLGFRYRKIPYEVEAYKHERNYRYLEIHDPEIWAKIKHLMPVIPPWEFYG
jgi:hypothetical protein